MPRCNGVIEGHHRFTGSAHMAGKLWAGLQAATHIVNLLRFSGSIMRRRSLTIDLEIVVVGGKDGR